MKPEGLWFREEGMTVVCARLSGHLTRCGGLCFPVAPEEDSELLLHPLL